MVRGVLLEFCLELAWGPVYREWAIYLPPRSISTCVISLSVRVNIRSEFTSREGYHLPTRSLNTFISSQAAPRRHFFQHLGPQVKHKIQFLWIICYVYQKMAEISAAASKYHKWGPGNNLRLVFVFRFYQLQRSLVHSLSPSLRWAALASDVALFCSRAELWWTAQTCIVWALAQNGHSVDSR